MLHSPVKQKQIEMPREDPVEGFDVTLEGMADICSFCVKRESITVCISCFCGCREN